MNREIEDGMGFSGLVPTKAEREADRRHEREVRAHFVQVDTLRARIRDLEQLRDRAYMRLQCADVPRDPWHWEVSTMLVTQATALEPLPTGGA